MADLWEKASFAVLLVTHDVAEAVYLADLVLVMSSRPSRIFAEIADDLRGPGGSAIPGSSAVLPDWKPRYSSGSRKQDRQPPASVTQFALSQQEVSNLRA